jgi:modification target Cys-rich repeat protein
MSGRPRVLWTNEFDDEGSKTTMPIFTTRKSLAALGLTAGLATVSFSGCGENGLPNAESLCGPCGSIATGQLSISGNAQLDGFFTAVADLQGASASVRGNFEGELRALAAIYGRADAEINADLVTALIADIRADINASVSGSFRLQYAPPRCSASVDVAIEAQAQCEASADCEVSATPPSASVECSGSCTGSCSGGCSGSISCTPPSGSVGCDVGCEGECALEAAAACDGVCRGQCDGDCSAEVTNGQGQTECQGECAGDCQGSCELRAGASCMGTCHGTCHASVTPPECEATPIRCNAECSGSCEGGCAGDFTPPSASANCEASAECNAQASARAEANLSCTPPSLEFGFELDTSLDANARAQFLARLGLVRVHLAGALQAAAQARALFNGEINGEVVFSPSPVARVTGQIQGFISGGIDGFAELDIPVGRIDCVIPAFQASISALADVSADLQFTAQASVELFAFIGNPTG